MALAPALLLPVLVAAVISGPWGPATGRMQPPAATPGIPGDPVRGERLYRRLDCVRCHSEPRTAGGVNVPPPLSAAGSRARAPWMAGYILDPKPLRFRSEDVRPDLRMPRTAISAADAADLAAYLAGQVDTVLVPAWSGFAAPATIDTLVAQGRMLFRQYQCQGCHELAGEGRRVGPALDGVGARRQPGYIRALLLDPQRVIPGTSMKNYHLWDEEADALTAFLITLSEADTTPVAGHDPAGSVHARDR